MLRPDALIDDGSQAGETPEGEPDARSVAEAARVATRMYALLGRRDGVLGEPICSDPAWNMLLDLLMVHGTRRRLSVSDVCSGSRAPAATAHRYLVLLVYAGLVSRDADAVDGRRHHVRLTSRGLACMVDLLLEG